MYTKTIQYMAHSDLPLPAYAKSLRLHDQDKLVQFLNTHKSNAYEFTIDGGNVGKPILCAFLKQPSDIKAIILNLTKHEVHNTLSSQNYTCIAASDSRVIRYIPENKQYSSKL